jgi:hypothetical protein
VLSSIDSTGWDVDPVAHGMPAMEYQRGEAELLMSAFQHRAGGIDRFFHFPGLTRFGDNWLPDASTHTRRLNCPATVNVLVRHFAHHHPKPGHPAS